MPPITQICLFVFRHVSALIRSSQFYGMYWLNEQNSKNCPFEMTDLRRDQSSPKLTEVSLTESELQMEVHGIPSERIDLLPLTASNSDHLATYSQMDISLDPWPYAGTTTTCESLYMGVPVVSLAGNALSSPCKNYEF